MSMHLDAEFSPLDLEALPAEERAAIRAHLAACPACGQQQRLAAEALALFAEGLVVPLPGPPPVWDRVAASLELERGFAAHAVLAADLLDLSLVQARAALALGAEQGGWQDGPAPDCWYREVPRGPGRQGTLAALVKLKPGASFPHHLHLGNERALVLHGAYRTGEGRRVRAGELHEMAGGTSHALVAEPGAEVVYLAVVEGGVDLGGLVLRPSHG